MAVLFQSLHPCGHGSHFGGLTAPQALLSLPSEGGPGLPDSGKPCPGPKARANGVLQSREGKELAQGHTVSWWPGWDWDAASFLLGTLWLTVTPTLSSSLRLRPTFLQALWPSCQRRGRCSLQLALAGKSRASTLMASSGAGHRAADRKGYASPPHPLAPPRAGTPLASPLPLGALPIQSTTLSGLCALQKWNLGRGFWIPPIIQQGYKI